MEKIKKFCLNNVASLVTIVLIGILILIPTGFENAVIYKNAEKEEVEIVAVDNSAIIDTGLIRSGEQSCTVKVLGGIFKNQETRAVNLLQGSLESDKIFAVGERAFAVIYHKEGAITSATLLDHFRLSWEILLAGIFIVFLVAFAGKTGVHAVFPLHLQSYVFGKY